MRFTLKQLEVFLTIARTGSTTGAAKRLNLSQSAVSAALKALESHYEQTLFDRVGKQLVLSPTGRTVLPHAQRLIDFANEFDSELKGTEIAGELTVGASFTIANHVIVDVLVDFIGKHPGVNVNLQSDNSPGIAEMVLNRQVDLGLVENIIRHESIQSTAWLSDELIIFCAPEHPLALSKSVSMDELVSATWVLRETGSGARTVFDETFERHLSSINTAVEFRHNEPIKRAVSSGLGIGCLSSRVIDRELADGTLTTINVPVEARMLRRFYLIQHAEVRLSAPAETFATACLGLH